MLFDRMSKEMVQAMIETMPAEITIIDSNDEVVAWNQHNKRIFKRPMSCMGMDFRQCHPVSSIAKVEEIVAEMKSGAKDKASFWIDLELKPGEPKHKIFIEFYALRSQSGEYLGCMEFTQDVEEIRRLQGQKRLMDGQSAPGAH